jgi:hypothetical protein
MSLSQRTLRRIEKFFSKNGFQYSQGGEESDEIILSNGKEEILVKIVFDEEAERIILYDALATVVEKAQKYSMVYVAAPRLLGESIETASFIKKGVGLVVYDDYSVEEKIAAISFKKASSVQSRDAMETQFTEKSFRRMESLIRELSERVDSLEKAYFSLLREVREIRSILEKRITVLERPVEKPQPKLEELIEPEGLPSFLKDNPWVEILSKRPEENP